jgi:tRNA-specific 2-thiouridylase
MKKVLLLMSGGVDSSVSAYLLLKQGYEVIGANFYLPYGNNLCCGVEGIEDARSVCQKLKIPFYVFNCKKEFEEEVITYFYEEYKNGRTPNPCVMCNRKIKFGILLEKAKSLGIDYIATGHYARIKKIDNRLLLMKSKYKKYDQSYVLYFLTQEKLSYSLFPVGLYSKNMIRRLGKKLNLNIYNKPSSQEICFIPDNDYRKFLISIDKEIAKPGPVLFVDGRKIGEHKGIAFYTIGQRSGFGIAYKKPLYVIHIDKERNEIILGEEKHTYSSGLIAKDINWIAFEKLDDKIKVDAKIRYSHKPVKSEVIPINDNKVKVIFDIPQRSVTPGQIVVFYKGDIVIGGGIIEKSI